METSRLAYLPNPRQPWINSKKLWETHTKKKCTQEALRKFFRLRKKIEEFLSNGSCTKYCYHKRKSVISRNNVHVTRLCEKPYWWYILHVVSTHKINPTYMRRYMDEENTRWVRNKRRKDQVKHLYLSRLRRVL